jgi:hypothetical protein
MNLIKGDNIDSSKALTNKTIGRSAFYSGWIVVDEILLMVFIE